MLIDSAKVAYEVFQACRHFGWRTEVPPDVLDLMRALFDLLDRTLDEVERRGALVIEVPDSWLDAVHPYYREAVGADPGADRSPIHRLHPQGQQILQLVRIAAGEFRRLLSSGAHGAMRSLGYALHPLPDLIPDGERFEPDMFGFNFRIAAFHWSALSPEMQQALCELARIEPSEVERLLGEEGFVIDMYRDAQ